MVNSKEKKIMVIDDENDMITFFTTFFEDNNYHTEFAYDGEEALEKILKNKPDLITLDIEMPNKSGFKLYRELKKNDSLKNIPVIIITGISKYGDFYSRDHKNLPKPEVFMEKPIDRNLLLEKVKELIG